MTVRHSPAPRHAIAHPDRGNWPVAGTPVQVRRVVAIQGGPRSLSHRAATRVGPRSGA